MRLAYSHREKAEVAIRQCDRSLQDGGVDKEHHVQLHAVYERELQSAQRTIHRLLGVEQARLESLEAQRRAALEEQLHLPERVTAGKIAARQANDANRRLSQRLTDIDGQIAVCRSRLESRTSEELGGFIDLAFPEYAAADTRPVLQREAEQVRGRVRDWYYTSTFAIAAAVAVFLPWLSKGGVTSSLATADSGLAQLAVQAGLPGDIARLAWVFFAVIPFLGVLATAGRNVRVFGWGFLLLGLAMLACAVFPGLALGASGDAPANVMQLAASFRFGAILYCASAIGFVVLGAFRVSPPGDSLRHATAVSLALLGSVGGIGLLAVLALLGVQGVSRVAFSAMLDDTARDRIAFSVTNEGRDPIACYFPLPANADDMVSPVGASHTFGLRVDVKEKGRDTYSAIPSSSRVWNIAQGPLPEDQNVVVNAGAVLKGNLELRQLSALGVDPASVRIQLLSRDGSLVEETEVVLDGRYLSAPGPIRDPLVIAPPPSRPSAALPSPKMEAAPEESKTTVGDALKVKFVGAIGGRAIIHVFAPDASAYEEVIAGPGETVPGGWIVESLVRQPSSVNMKHASTGASVQAIRGNVVEISPAARN